jgi:hypothetical protein
MKKFETRNEMLEKFHKDSIIAELGVFEGEFSKIIYEICKPSKLYLVDLFEGYFGSGDKDGKNHHYVQLEDEMSKLQEHFKDDSSVEIIKSYSTEFLKSLPNEILDIVYIDADHSIQGCLDDLNLSYDKVKVGGLICGHDYVSGVGPFYAVNQFCNERGLKIEMITNDGCPSFCIIKQ